MDLIWRGTHAPPGDGLRDSQPAVGRSEIPRQCRNSEVQAVRERHSPDSGPDGWCAGNSEEPVTPWEGCGEADRGAPVGLTSLNETGFKLDQTKDADNTCSLHAETHLCRKQPRAATWRKRPEVPWRRRDPVSPWTTRTEDIFRHQHREEIGGWGTSKWLEILSKGDYIVFKNSSNYAVKLRSLMLFDCSPLLDPCPSIKQRKKGLMRKIKQISSKNKISIWTSICALRLVSWCVRLFATPWTVACQAPLSLGIFQARILE